MAMKHLKWFWHSPNGEQEIARLKATRLFIVQDNNADNSGGLELAVGPIRLINSNPHALFKDVLLPDAEAETAVGTFVRVIIKRLAPVGGIQTFQQVELVLNPFVLNIQVSFIKTIVAFFGGKKSKKRGKKELSEEGSTAATITETLDMSVLSAEPGHEEDLKQ